MQKRNVLADGSAVTLELSLASAARVRRERKWKARRVRCVLGPNVDLRVPPRLLADHGDRNPAVLTLQSTSGPSPLDER